MCIEYSTIFLFCQYPCFDLPLGLWYSKTRTMNPDFFVRLTMAVYKVADILPRQDSLRVQIEDSANKLLASLIFLVQENLVTKEQKQSMLPKAIRELGVLIAYLNYTMRTSKLNPENFLVLEREYNKVEKFLRQLHQDTIVADSGDRPAPQRQTFLQSAENLARPRFQQKPEVPKRDLGAPKSHLGNGQNSKANLSGRQTRIMEIIRNKPKTQVWELQKVLPEVTKRTLRRDLDNLLYRELIIRQGEWNEVSYQIR